MKEKLFLIIFICISYCEGASFLFSEKDITYNKFETLRTYNSSIDFAQKSKNYKSFSNLHLFLRQSLKNSKWIKISFKTKFSQVEKKAFLFQWKNAKVDFYLFQKDKMLLKKEFVANQDDGIFHASSDLYPNQEYEIFLFIHNKKKNDEFSYFNIIDYKDLYKTITINERFFNNSFFFGVIVVLFINAFLSYLILREKSVLYFSLFLFNIILIVSDFRFLVYDYIDNETFNFILIKSILPSLIHIFFLLFSQEFFDLKKNYPRINNFINVLIAFYATVIIFKIIIPEIHVTILYINVFHSVLLYPTMKNIMKKDLVAVYYGIGLIFFITFYNFYVINYLFSLNFVFIQGIQVAIALEGLFFNIALQDKMRQVFQEKEKFAQEQLKNKELVFAQSKLASMGEMIGNIAHQWRQPLNNTSLILGNIQLRDEMNKLDSKILNEKIEEANEQLKFMSHTIEDFRNFFSNNIKNEEFLLQDICKEALKLTKSTLENKHIAIIEEYQDEIYIVGKKSELIQVLIILLTNAKDAFIMNNIDYRTIEIITNDSYIEIKDNAGGIKEEILLKIFEPYFSTKNKKMGTGLGLYMAKMIVEEHFNAQLQVKSEKDSTSFTITL